MTVILVVSYPTSSLSNVTDPITDLTPMANLTMLDYRNLADAVEHFDPGPWTTHEAPAAEPEPEDPAEEMLGMAEVIRNEQTYKDDEMLHDLPDDLMILAWALSTSPNVEVVG